MKESNNDADVTFIRALAELLRENDLTELHVERDMGADKTLNVRVVRTPPPQAAPAAFQPAAPATAPTAHAQSAAAPAPASETPEDPADHPGAVASPMVGTVYLQPEPGADPFVAVGATVSEGQTIMIVEAMKTMNHIPAPKAGTVRRILVEDQAAVEYGTPLVIID
ncbi:acetyl-CoA carboxylase biotin carboxyl carrier protein [Chachezhania antarctica]|uniref:acetyl-CoA carboxylase biotin carboxyl carrier protein n=1 Tax=Chachezhania antarctica TaxID=2340860 RepID=UPI000EB584E1|nr:acetyl-CoA carboxylase biotin carboxyl carrier protein [Chachezhania antarctica]|tara:strand:+ start:227 stop:727 length:501 start_codon:yes stop_codon:yes gene_type:complete